MWVVAERCHNASPQRVLTFLNAKARWATSTEAFARSLKLPMANPPLSLLGQLPPHTDDIPASKTHEMIDTWMIWGVSITWPCSFRFMKCVGRDLRKFNLGKKEPEVWLQTSGTWILSHRDLFQWHYSSCRYEYCHCYSLFLWLSLHERPQSLEGVQLSCFVVFAN